jgi:hypothetical protein
MKMTIADGREACLADIPTRKTNVTCNQYVSLYIGENYYHNLTQHLHYLILYRDSNKMYGPCAMFSNYYNCQVLKNLH